MEWERVLFAGECPSCEACGEPWCPKCKIHYADCSCIGPTEDEAEYKVVDGILYGRRADKFDYHHKTTT